jgi:hypothetical protein
VTVTPRGVRNGNPGNLRNVAGTVWQGQTGIDDAGFCVFDTPENGIRALARTLISYQVKHHLTTLGQMIDRWAPPVENDTDAYVNAVCKACSASPNNPYTLTPSRLATLAAAIIHQENGEQPYADAVIEAGVDSAFL